MDNWNEPKNYLTVRFNDHIKVDEKKPFVVYSISVFTRYSKTNLNHRYSNFVKLSESLRQFENDDKVMLPRFPNSKYYIWNLHEDFIASRKEELEQYSQNLLDLHSKMTNVCWKESEGLRIPSLRSKRKYPYIPVCVQFELNQ